MFPYSIYLEKLSRFGLYKFQRRAAIVHLKVRNEVPYNLFKIQIHGHALGGCAKKYSAESSKVVSSKRIDSSLTRSYDREA